jgi:DnaJ-domain-containing protein 1
MVGQFHVDTSTPADPPHFADQIAQLFGEDSDLDPLFLEESWTLGVPAATGRWQHRQRAHADRERQSQSFRDLHNLASIHFVEAADPAAFIPQALAAAVQKGYGAASPQSPAQPEAPTFIDERNRPCQGTARPMTPRHAHRLLGVSAATTPAQLRSAYRRMVSQCHPDRLGPTTDDARQRATDRMAAINEAYRLLRTLTQSA